MYFQYIFWCHIDVKNKMNDEHGDYITYSFLGKNNSYKIGLGLVYIVVCQMVDVHYCVQTKMINRKYLTLETRETSLRNTKMKIFASTRT